MKKLLLTLVTIAAVSVGLPAVADAQLEEEANWQQDDWNNGGNSYAEFDQEYRHIWNGIRHGLGDGSYTPREANYFYRQMQNIRARADWQARSGYYDGGQIQAALEQLHDRMHNVHERGHDRQQQYYYGNRGGYGYGQPSAYGNPYGYRDQNRGNNWYSGDRR